jgi:hypothetical protein
VPAGKLRRVALMLKAIHAQEDRAAARRKADEVIGKLKAIRLPKTAEIVERGIDEMLAYFAFPEEHWGWLRTNNPLERIMREIRRRTRVVGAFPDGQSSLSLAFAALGNGGRILDAYMKIIERPHGIVLVTGPTGSGKTTTLYASTQRAASTCGPSASTNRELIPGPSKMK